MACDNCKDLTAFWCPVCSDTTPAKAAVCEVCGDPTCPCGKVVLRTDAELIDALRACRWILSQQVAAHRWIPVTERLPDVYVKVFVRMETCGFSVGERRDEPGCHAWCCAGFGYGIQEPADKVTHWRPFDAAPEASK